ncbi:MAG: hypothetical protein RIT43_1281 [Bacteroidota bacterium]|jgi:hypothetical protein
MEHSKKINSALAEVNTLISKLHSGNLQLGELEALVEQSRELYELSLVLRYKAYESHSGSKEDETSDSTQPETVIIQNIEVNNIFEINADEQEVAFPESIDFSSMGQDKEMVVSPVDLFADEESHTEPLKEELESKTIEPEETVEELMEDPIRTFAEQLDAVSESEDNEFIKKFSAFDSALQTRIAMSRIDTLKGSFGLNERLQFINELFDGSSEAFSEAVKTIDEQASEMEALKKASALAARYQWDNESETVEEFVLKIKRRYA